MNNFVEILIQKDNSQKRVLQYVREPVLIGKMYREYGDIIAKKYLKVSHFDKISEIDKSVEHFIDIRKYEYFDFTVEDFEIFEKIIDVNNVIRDERIFRYDLPYFEALELVYGCTKFFLKFFKENKYDILLAHTVDEYVGDIMMRVAKYYGIAVVGYCANSYDSRYISITERGEYQRARQPGQEEIEEFFNFLSQKASKPYFFSPKTTYRNIARKYFIYKAKYLLHYLILHKIMGRNSYRYMMTRSDTYPRNLKDIIGAPRFMYQSIDQIPETLLAERTVYIPLHYHPEATTDYWISELGYPTYYPSLFKTIRYYSERGFRVLVKEHTASYMQRDINIYEAISKIPHVYLLSPFITTYKVFDYAEYVVVWTGTTGVEALMQGKKVMLAAGETYYSFGKLARVGQEKEAQIPTEADKKEVAEAILASFLPILQ